MKHGTCRHDAAAKVRNTESLEVLCLEMFCQLFIRKLIGKGPVIKFKGKIFAAETLLETFFQSTLKEYLLGVEVDEQFLDVVKCTLGNKELAC